MDKLSAFVKEQISSGVSAAELKQHMLQNGWNEADIDLAIQKANGGTTKNRIFIGLVALLLVGVLALILISFAKPHQPDIPSVPASNNNQQLQVEPKQTCETMETSLEKDECYKNLLRTGLDCSTLTNAIEKTYCSRAYEDILLQGVERIDEG